MYSNLRSLIFKIDPERAHFLAIQSLKLNLVSNIFDENKNDPVLKTKLFNLHLDNPIGIAAGLDKNLIKNVEFFDLYVAKDLGDDSKSVTFRVTIQSKEKTLEEKDLEQLHKNILEKVSNKFKAKIRS